MLSLLRNFNFFTNVASPPRIKKLIKSYPHAHEFFNCAIVEVRALEIEFIENKIENLLCLFAVRHSIKAMTQFTIADNGP